MSWVFCQSSKFYLYDNETLLEGLLRTHHPVAYECCQGYCGTCKTRLIVHNGSITHTLPPLCHLEADEVLACCCLADGVIELIQTDT